MMLQQSTMHATHVASGGKKNELWNSYSKIQGRRQYHTVRFRFFLLVLDYSRLDESSLV